MMLKLLIFLIALVTNLFSVMFCFAFDNISNIVEYFDYDNANNINTYVFFINIKLK